jgi:hypothetical protein
MKIDESHMKIMRNFSKKKDDASFKKFVSVRTIITNGIKADMKMWVSDKELQDKISLEIDKKFTKEVFPSKGMFFVERYLATRMPDSFFKCMV